MNSCSSLFYIYSHKCTLSIESYQLNMSMCTQCRERLEYERKYDPYNHGGSNTLTLMAHQGHFDCAQQALNEGHNWGFQTTLTLAECGLEHAIDTVLDMGAVLYPGTYNVLNRTRKK